MPRRLGARLFSFAVITDTHVNFGETECNSEFEINKQANGRLRYVIYDLNRYNLAFVIHLGDVVHPVPALGKLYKEAADRFHAEINQLRHPIHLVPGNHDIGDKPIFWGVNGIVCDEFIALWKKNFGPNFHSFDHSNCQFFQIDSQIINSGLALESEQKIWLETNLKQASRDGKRIFVSAHYPPFLTDPSEAEHFDNIAEPGRSWLLKLFRRYEVEALFSGHVHNFWYNRYSVTDCYSLPSTAFVRQDYAEIYRVMPLPGTEGGRADLAKLGYFIVDVYEGGHICRCIRTFGQAIEVGDFEAGTELDAEDATIVPHSLENPNTRFGFDMRQNWLETIEIPPSGALDEFDRKCIRNDYPLMALLEMGVRRVRIPARDLLDPNHRSRLEDCAHQGLLFTLFSFGVPDQELLEKVSEARDIIDCWEICHAVNHLPAVLEATKTINIPLYVSKIHSKEDMERSLGNYYHRISHGFTPYDLEQIADLSRLKRLSGFVFRIDGNLSPWQAAHEITSVCRKYGMAGSLHIRMSKGTPGEFQENESWVAERTAEAICVSASFPDFHVYMDTFADVDRGYYRRFGIIDRFYNPRPGFHIVRNLNGALAQGFEKTVAGTFLPGSESKRVQFFDDNGQIFSLCTPNIRPASFQGIEGQTKVIDLFSGKFLETNLAKSKNDLNLAIPDFALLVSSR